MWITNVLDNVAAYVNRQVLRIRQSNNALRLHLHLRLLTTMNIDRKNSKISSNCTRQGQQGWIQAEFSRDTPTT